MDEYPDSAYNSDGILWWEADFYPGTRRPFGGEQKIASWLQFNVEPGGTFSMPSLRAAIGSDAEHLNRRLRKLREYWWVVPSYQDDRTLGIGEYRLDQKGWWVGQGPRPKKSGVVSLRVRRIVFDRDGSRCAVCGVGSREPYPGEPMSSAVMTVGHRVAQALGGSDALENLRTECSRCNEPRREEGDRPRQLDEIFGEVRRLSTNDLRILHQWLVDGQRGRSKLDDLYDRARFLGHEEQLELRESVHTILTGGRNLS